MKGCVARKIPGCFGGWWEEVWEWAQGPGLRGKELAETVFIIPNAELKVYSEGLSRGWRGRLEPPAKLSKNVGRSQQSGKKQLGIVFFLKGISDSWFLCITLNHPQCSLKDSELTKLSK